MLSSRPVKLVAATAAATLIAVIASITTTAYASHFTDVGNGSFFHQSIAEIAEAGCASGFNDGSFRPKAGATRGQFAYWTANCATRIDSGEGSFTGIDKNDATVLVASVRIGNPSLGTGSGLVNLVGSVQVETDAADCPCDVASYIGDASGNAYSHPAIETLGDGGNISGRVSASIANATSRPVPAGSAETFNLWARVDDNNAVVDIRGDLHAVFTPFEDREPNGVG